MTPTHLPSPTAINIDKEVRAWAGRNHGPWSHTDFLNHSNNSKVGQGENNIGKPTGRENV